VEPKVSGWILPEGSWHECRPWEHLEFAKSLERVILERPKNKLLNETWDAPDDEQIREALAQIGLIKVCYHLIDADFVNPRQLRMLQQVYGFHSLACEIEFIGKIKARMELRLFMKLRDPDRLNTLAG
jgi:hypothetical protein